MAKMSFSGKVVLVTGGNSGIGAAIARAFAQHGAIVTISGRDSGRGTDVATAIGQPSRPATFIAADLREPKEADRLISEVVKRFGRLDVLINNAGIHHRFGTLETTAEQWFETMAINLNAAFFLSRAAARVMKDHGGGVIVNNASDLAFFTEVEKVSYCTSKAALTHMTKAMALDLAPHKIRVNAVAPGDTFTPLIEQKIAKLGLDIPAGKARLAAPVPLKRLADTDEIAEAFLFLASDDASYVTGATLSVDGGTSAAGPSASSVPAALSTQP
ncbi:MAG: SDR family oxidoreductase [Rhodospirillales bacterium]|nr:SDR family oxidoreductase [Rhodospirillales bacterium]